MKNNYSIKLLILSSFFASLTAICSIVSFPLPFSPVPVNLALLAVYLSGTLLGPGYGALSQVIYMLLGAIGLPVYHNLTGGLAILAGPTGGFIVGYIAAAFLAGLRGKQASLSIAGLRGKQASLSIAGLRGKQASLSIAGLALKITGGLFICYTLGTIWFIYISGSNLHTALLLCVIPFLPGDALKIIGAVLLTKKLEPILNRLK